VLLDGVPVKTVDMTDDSFLGAGQRVDLGGAQTFSSLTIRIDDANVKNLASWIGFSNVGFKEVTVPGVSAQEWIVTPSAGVDDLAPSSTNVSYLFSRIRSNPVEGFRQDTELQMRRIFRVGATSQFTPLGRARLSAGMNGAVIDSIIGRPGLSDGFPIVSGTSYLEGDLAARPSSALDGDLATAWTSKFDNQVGATFTVTNPSTTTFDHLRLSVINDQEHSIPTVLNLTLDDGSTHPIEVPAIETVSEKGNVATVDIPTGTLTSKSIGVTIAAERPVTTKEFFSGGQRILPIAIAELGLPTTVAPLPSSLPTTCRSGLATIDGVEQSFVLNGTVSDAISREALDLVPCGPSETPQTLTPGDHQFVTTKGLDSAIDIDAMQLHSVPQGQYTTAVNPPSTTVTSTRKNSYRVDIADASDPFWLVLGQSLSNGWKATVRGGESLGDPTLIDGFANGWQIDPAKTGATFTVDISWTPQKTVWGGLAISFFWFIGLCVAALAVAWRRRILVRALPSATDPLLVTSELTNTTSTALRIGVLIGMTALSAFVGGLGVAITMAIITALLLWTRRRSAVSALVVFGSIGGIVLLYTGLQFGHDYRSTAVWPSSFMFAHQLGLVAVLAVVSETVTRWLFRIRSKTTQRASDANQINDGSALTR